MSDIQRPSRAAPTGCCRPIAATRDWSVFVLSCSTREGHDGRNPENRGDLGGRRRRLQSHGERGRGPNARAAAGATRRPHRPHDSSPERPASVLEVERWNLFSRLRGCATRSRRTGRSLAVLPRACETAATPFRHIRAIGGRLLHNSAPITALRTSTEHVS